MACKNRKFSPPTQAKASRERSGDLILILAGGEKTETNYFTALRNRLRLSREKITVVYPGYTDPLSLLKEAEAEKYQNKYDQIWLVCDLEAVNSPCRKQYQQACKQIKTKEKIRFAVSTPCFEYWYILHYEYTSRHLPDDKAARKRLKQHIPDYLKGNFRITEDFFAKTKTAVTHAKRLRADQSIKEPQTSVDLLVAELNQHTLPENRLLRD